MLTLNDSNQKHQQNIHSSAQENLTLEPTTEVSESPTKINSNSLQFSTAQANHLKEWVEESVISEAIAELNLRSLENKEQIAELLNWQNYIGSPGWCVRSIDLETGQYRNFGQFKPDVALQFPNQAKPQKYLSFPKGSDVEIILLLPDLDTWQRIADKYQVPIEPQDLDDNRLDQGFWRWVAKNPQLPIEITEGAKKSGCLLANDYISICLTGVWNGKQRQKLKAIPSLAPFLTNGRPIHLVFDSDIVVKQQVQEALKHTGYLATKQGCIVGVATWDYAEDTKGVDDLIKNRGISAFKEVMDNLIPFKEWLKQLKQPADRERGLLKLDTRKLISYVRTKYRDRLRFNQLQQKIELDGVELLLEEAYLLLAEEDGVDCSKTKAADIFTKIATENAYSPVINYLDTVAEKISPVNLDNLSQRYFGTTEPIYDVFLKRTLIAAVARTYEPGCKHDTTLVLQGLQGAGKSSFFDVLGGDWFDDSMGDGHNKDDLIILHKSWIQEWGEIERTFSKRQSEELKAFITRRKDLFRPPYGRSALEFPRQSIIVGTANSTEFLVDSTGSRRYWIVPLATNKININLLKEERDRIWSAAVKAYRNGEQWWLSESEEKLSNHNNQQFQIVDEWQGAIADYLEYREKVSVTEILQQVFDFEAGKIDRRAQMRVANILTSLQWKKVGQQKHQGKRQVIWQSTIPQKGGIAEVLHSQTQSQQGISTPAIPAIPISETSHGQESSLQPQPNHLKLEEKVQSGIEVWQPPSQQGIQATTPLATPPAIPQELDINWEDYPYGGKDRYTLENRASKVKERILNCHTSNELIALYAEGKISEPEIEWLKKNYLTEAESQQLQVIENSTQGNLFSSKKQEVVELDYEDIEKSIDWEMQRVGWGLDKGREHLINTYGKKSRKLLNDEQLFGFWDYLKSLPDVKPESD